MRRSEERSRHGAPKKVEQLEQPELIIESFSENFSFFFLGRGHFQVNYVKLRCSIVQNFTNWSFQPEKIRKLVIFRLVKHLDQVS